VDGDGGLARMMAVKGELAPVAFRVRALSFAST